MKVINDLYDYENYKIVQNSEYFKFSLDSILLAEYVDEILSDYNILDLCSGNGAVPLILSYYYKNKIFGFELQKEIFKLALESIEINDKNQQIKIYNDDVKNIKNYFPGNNFDVITVNPPYFKYTESSLINKNSIKSIARHEIYLNLEDLIKTCSYLLKNNSTLYMVHIPTRLDEIIILCNKYNMNVKEIVLITNSHGDSVCVLIKAIKNSKYGLKLKCIGNIDKMSSYKYLFK